MSTRTSFYIQAALILLSIFLGVYFYPLLPERIASHWGADGAVNGYTSKFWGLFLMPCIMVFMIALFAILPAIDPLKKNVVEFRKYYNLLVTGIIGFLFYVNMLTLFWNTGEKFSMTAAIMIPLAGLWYLIGAMLPKTKQNWFMGIRTPWTLADEGVWDKTHVLGGKVFRASSGFILLGAVFPSLLWLFFIAIIFSALVPVVYSYVLFSKKPQ